MSSKKCFQVIEGVHAPVFFSTECFLSALRYKPKTGDIFIATYPKCGTTWMQNIAISILRKGKSLERQLDFFLASPFLEQLGSEDSQRLMIRPGVLKTHFTFEKVPWSDEAKYIYVARNPKDCCVSLYHHMRQLPLYEFSETTFDEFFEMFIHGEVEFGDYFDHILGWYGQRNKPNIFFITYEELKRDIRSSVRRVAKFLGEEYWSYIEQNPNQLNSIVANCSFGNMKPFVNESLSFMYAEENLEALLADPNIPIGRKHIIRYLISHPPKSQTSKNIEFVRKGVVGDWVNYFTEEQNNRMEQKMHDTSFKSTAIKLWADYYK